MSASWLLQVAAHEIDQLIGGLRPFGFSFDGGIGHVEANVILEDFGHEAVQRAACRRERLQHGAAIAFCLEEFLHAVELTANALHAVEELCALANGVRHGITAAVRLTFYTGV